MYACSGPENVATSQKFEALYRTGLPSQLLEELQTIVQDLDLVSPILENHSQAPPYWLLALPFDIVVRFWVPYGSRFHNIPAPLLQRTVFQAMDALEALLQFPIPCREKLDFVVLTDYPLGGMEHHGLIFLHEDLLGPQHGKGTSSSSSLLLPSALTRTMIHELAHHWFGNFVGLPFVLKEGLCLVLEKVIEAQITEGGTGQSVVRKVPTQRTTSNGNNVVGVMEACTTRPTTVRTGKELTGETYQDAELLVLQMIADCGGWLAFVSKLRGMLRHPTVIRGSTSSLTFEEFVRFVR